MKAITLRFSDLVHELVSEEAEQEGISIAQFCREAAIARVFFQAGKRGEVRSFDRLARIRQGFEDIGVDPDMALDVVCTAFKTLPEPAEGEEPEPDPVA